VHQRLNAALAPLHEPSHQVRAKRTSHPTKPQTDEPTNRRANTNNSTVLWEASGEARDAQLCTVL
jgi:hypothetical protein